ncbi:hypothetical protein [Pseudomonas sp. 3A(2025)]
MTLTKTVLGVLGLCWVDLANMTHERAAVFAGLRGGVSSVSGLRARARLSVILLADMKPEKTLHAMPNKPTKPNTLNTNLFKPLILKVCKCVGFVLGWVVLCRVRFFMEKGQ